MSATSLLLFLVVVISWLSVSNEHVCIQFGNNVPDVSISDSGKTDLGELEPCSNSRSRASVSFIQSVAVNGTLLCGTSPARSVRVKLFDKKSGLFTRNVLLAETRTSTKGVFSINATAESTTVLRPLLTVYHRCNHLLKVSASCLILIAINFCMRYSLVTTTSACLTYRTLSLEVPEKYVTNGTVAAKVFNIGTVNLEAIYQREGRKLFV
uniref:Transthyretin-like family protein n=1 Tax=Syphacia muris TaxID=451379 RepID=A0A0N5AI02_9BILA